MTQVVTRAGKREWLGLAVLTLPTMLAMLDITVLLLAVPHLTTDLSASAVQQLWIIDIYGFVMAGFLVTMGTLGDRIGRRRLLLIGAVGFAVASVLAAYAWSPEVLIAARALLGVAGAAVMPTTLAIIMGMFQEPKQRAAAVSVWASALTAGVALGPVVGGVMLQWFWWGSVFLLGVPVMLALLMTGPVLLRESKGEAGGRLEFTSVLLSLAAILSVVLGLKEIAGGGNVLALVALLAGLGFGLAFVLRQRRLPHPLLDVRLFRIPAISGALMLGLLVAAVQAGSGFFVAQHLQTVLGLGPLRAGLWLLVPTLALVVGIFVSQGLAQRVRPAYVMAAGAAVAAVGMSSLTQVGAATSLAVVVIGFTVVYIGVSPVGPLVAQLVVPSAPPEKAGSAASLQSTSGELGIALGLAVLGSIGMAVYQREVVIPPELAGTPAGEMARETAAGATAAAPELPPAVAEPLVASAHAAFTSGLNTAAIICAVAFVTLAVLAVVTLRQVPPLGTGASGSAAPAPTEAPEPTTEAEAHAGSAEPASQELPQPRSSPQHPTPRRSRGH